MVAGLKVKEYAEPGLDTLEERRQKQDMALVYKLTQDGQKDTIFVYWYWDTVRCLEQCRRLKILNRIWAV